MDDRDERQFESELLEAALRERARTQPRAGLEERILSGVEARRAPRFPALPRWAWILVAGAAAVAVVAAIKLHRPPVSGPPLTSATSAPTPTLVKPSVSHPLITRVPPPAANSQTVRLAVFPAPRPLSPQEKLLLAYVRKGRLEEGDRGSLQPLDEDLKVPKLDVAALDIKPIEVSQESSEK